MQTRGLGSWWPNRRMSIYPRPEIWLFVDFALKRAPHLCQKTGEEPGLPPPLQPLLRFAIGSRAVNSQNKSGYAHLGPVKRGVTVVGLEYPAGVTLQVGMDMQSLFSLTLLPGGEPEQGGLRE